MVLLGEKSINGGSVAWSLARRRVPENSPLKQSTSCKLKGRGDGGAEQRTTTKQSTSEKRQSLTASDKPTVLRLDEVSWHTGSFLAFLLIDSNQLLHFTTFIRSSTDKTCHAEHTIHQEDSRPVMESSVICLVSISIFSFLLCLFFIFIFLFFNDTPYNVLDTLSLAEVIVIVIFLFFFPLPMGRSHFFTNSTATVLLRHRWDGVLTNE